MAWRFGDSKILKIAAALDEGLSDIMKTLREDLIGRISSEFLRLEPVSVIPECPYGSALFPCEPIGEYRLSVPISDLSPESEVPGRILMERGFSVGAIDSGIFSLGPHMLVDLTVVNVGIWVHNYGDGSGICDNVARVISYVGGSRNIQVLVKDFEIEILEEFLTEMNGSLRFLLLDESLSLAYTLAWSAEDREEMVERVLRMIDLALRHNVVPIGVFYTRAMDISRGIATMTGSEVPEASDRALMNTLISAGSRSPLFLVHSKAIRGKIDILAFYLKVGDKNVLRVEFPQSARNLTDEIYLVVLLQSILGGGYPLALQRAHSLAVIGRDEREFIINEVCRRLGLPELAYVFSKKYTSKRWPVI